MLQYKNNICTLSAMIFVLRLETGKKSSQETRFSSCF